MRIESALKLLAAAAVAAGLSMPPALAQATCAEEIATVEAAAQAASELADADLATVQAALDDARAKQAAGDEEGCTAALAPAKELLKLG